MVELVEEGSQINGAPTLRIDGSVVHSVSHQIEHVRHAICEHWKNLTAKPLIRTI
jgi:hypothetical protein